MLKSDLDTDELIKSIRDARTSFTLSSQNVSNSNSQKYALYILSNLLEKPSKEYLNALIISTQDNFYYFTNILKTLIKTKFLQLSCQENIVTIINMFYGILDDKKIAEPAIANLLRYSSFYPILQRLATNDIFTMYFKGIIGTIENPSITFGRDFVFEKACTSLLAPNHKISCYKGVKYLQYQTPRQFLITKISSTLELNLIFYIEKVNSNHHFYDFLLFNNYITSLEIAKDVLRYLVGVYYTNSTDKLINLISKILEYYNSETLLVAIFYDALFHQKNEEVNHFLFFYLCSKITDSAICNFLKERMKNDEIRQYFLCWLSKFGSKAQSIAAILEIDYVDLSHIQRRIELLDFDSYHGLISDMRVTKVPFIPHSIYNKIIDASFTWDGYMQVFLWKILAYQKIFFGFDVSYSNLETAESREGYEILINIK